MEGRDSEAMNTVATNVQTRVETNMSRALPRPDPAAMAESPVTAHRRRLREEINAWVQEPTEPMEPVELEEVDEFVRTEAEKDAAERAAARAITTMDQRKAAKEPMRQRRLMDMLDDEPEERPDLNMYFNDFPYEITDEERIKICRAYASYLVTLQPPKPKTVGGKRSKKN